MNEALSVPRVLVVEDEFMISAMMADALTAHLEHLSVHTFDVGSNLRASAKFAAEIVRTLQSPGT